MLATRRGRLAAVILGAIALGALLALGRPRARVEEADGPTPSVSLASAAPASASAAPGAVDAPPVPSPPAPSASPGRPAPARAAPALHGTATASPTRAAGSAPDSAPAPDPAGDSPEAPPRQAPSSEIGLVAVSCVDEGGLPVAGVRVEIDQDQGIALEATSDSRGWAERPVAPGRYTVAQGTWTVALEHRPEVEVTVAAGERREVTLRVRRTGTLEGVVVGGAPKSPRLRVVMRRDDSTSREECAITLDEAGRFTETRTAGVYEMTVLSDDGSSSAPQEVRILPDQTTRVTFAVGAGSALVVGRVRAARDGSPIAGATVEADCGMTSTDAAGEFVLRGNDRPPGQVRARAKGYVERAVALDATKPPPLDVTVDLAPGGALRIAVLDRDGKPANNARVVVKTRHGNSSSSHSTSADPAGIVTMGSLEPGTYRVYLEGSDDEHPDATLEVSAGEEAQATVRPR